MTTRVNRHVWHGIVLSMLLVVPIGMAQQAGQTAKPPTAAETKQPTQAKLQELTRMRASAMTARGAEYLIATQGQDGGWDSETGPGISCLVLKALIQQPKIGPEHPAVKRGLEFVLKFQREDGGIYSPEGLLQNYESSVALSMLAALKDSEHAKQIQALRDFLIKGQWDEGEEKSVDDIFYGGAGYGQHKRPDLSNTQMMLEALKDSGLPKDDPAYQKALIFIQRCQMRGESNDQPYAQGSSQGGFIYATANGGESKAGTVEIDGRTELRCYGSITYAGLKSMLYAGLSKDDPRVKAALEWISANWTLDHNPNMPGGQSLQGLFYYYHVFGRAMDACDEDVITDSSGKPHDWRQELVAALAKQQRKDGSWVNEADRWHEGKATLTTAYSMLALQVAFPGEASE
ncbi:MAG: hypothetical protein JXO22_11250 [Phycisphaerae bacterium]|nr:hypothetical protein [Phycisphaerae bacterium]